MEQFIACICDNDFSKLVVSGQPSAEEILEAWQTLFFEYCDLIEMSEDTFIEILDLVLKARERHLDIVRNWIKILKSYKSEKIAEAVEYLYPVKFDLDNEYNYNQAIAEVEAELRAMSFDIKVRRAEYEALSKYQSTKKDLVNRKFFTTIIMRLNNYLKMNPPISMQTSVEIYCAALRDFIAAIDKSEKSLNDAGI
jgi:hypothetical protein